MNRSALGIRGELDARHFLEARGMRFIAANWHCQVGELDLVMIDRDEVVFVEVKARRGERSGRAEESIGAAKSRSLLVAAEWFVSVHPEHHRRIWRIDLVALTYGPDDEIKRTTHIVNAIVTG